MHSTSISYPKLLSLTYIAMILPWRRLGILIGMLACLQLLGLGYEVEPIVNFPPALLDCTTDPGTLSPRPLSDGPTDCFDGSECVEVRADIVEEPVVDSGFSVLYVITSGTELVIMGTGPEPFFCIEDTGFYTIHTLVYNAATLDLSVILPGQSTANDLVELIAGHDTCAKIDLIGASFDIEPCPPCPEGVTPDPGSLVAAPFDCFDGQNPILITAETAIAPNIPDGYLFSYVLTQGEELSIIAISDDPTFSIANTGPFGIHGLVYDTLTLDLGMVELGTTTAGDVLAIIGDNICANLDVEGARFDVPPCVADPCEGVSLDAGTLKPTPSCLSTEDSVQTASLIAEHLSQPQIPEGYSSLYVLTQGEELLIVDLANVPNFSVTETGTYRIHTLVFDTLSLDLSGVELGTTTASQVLALLGDSICAALDVEGALFEIEACPNDPCEKGNSPDPGTLVSLSDTCLDGENPALLLAEHTQLPVIPEAFSSLYVLTKGSDLLILDTHTEPSFTVEETGTYRIHTLIYDPSTLDLGAVQPGETTAGDVIAIISDSICAALDVVGASYQIRTCVPPKDSICFEIKDYTLSTWGGDFNANFDHSLFFHHSPADPDYRMLGNRDFQQFFWETTGIYREYLNEDGSLQDSASIMGIVYSEVDPSLRIKVDFKLVHPLTWEEHQANGGDYKANLFSTEVADTAHVNWTYWEISPKSRLIGMDGLEGLVLEVSHAPISKKYKLQVGNGANDKDGSFGLSGWFKYRGEFRGTTYAEQGDINVDIDTCVVTDICVYKEPETNNRPVLQSVELEVPVMEDPRVAIAWTYFKKDDTPTTFAVDRSIDAGEFFETVGSFRAAKNKLFYSFVDRGVLGSASYTYRIRAVEEGNKESVSESQAVSIATSQFIIYPNPAQSTLFISPPIEKGQVLSLRVVDALGQLIESREARQLGKPIEWDISAYAKGVYLMRIETEDRRGIQVLRFVKN